MFNNQVILPKWLYKTPCVWWRKAVESLWYEYNEHLHSDSNCSSHLDSRICKNMYFKYAELIIKGSSMHTRSEMQFSNRIRGHFVGPTSIVFHFFLEVGPSSIFRILYTFTRQGHWNKVSWLCSALTERIWINNSFFSVTRWWRLWNNNPPLRYNN